MINYVLDIMGQVHRITVDVSDLEVSGLGEYLIGIGLLTESYVYDPRYKIISRS